MTSYTPHSIISQSSQSTNQKQTYMYFGRKGNVLFDDGNWYEGGFTGKDPKQNVGWQRILIEDP